jgi:hypothetical protein
VIEMGMECPNGHGRQAVILNITPDAASTARARDVVAKKLKCGCVVGGEEYNEFLEAIHRIDTEEQLAVEKLRKANTNKRAAAYKGMLKPQGA